MLREIKKKIIAKVLGLDFLYFKYNVNEARKIGVKVGRNCRFIGTNPDSFSTEPYLISIGNHVSMTRPRFITHDGSVWVFREKFPEIELFGTIIIGDNCFLGDGVLILPNTKVGNNCIIGANAILKGEYPNDSVIAGVPGRVIGTIQEYFEKNRNKFTYFRDYKPKDKVKAIHEHFNI
jgi:acetyltransferase-like isoleucine patch superfamily enzyme